MAILQALVVAKGPNMTSVEDMIRALGTIVETDHFVGAPEPAVELTVEARHGLEEARRRSNSAKTCRMVLNCTRILHTPLYAR